MIITKKHAFFLIRLKVYFHWYLIELIEIRLYYNHRYYIQDGKCVTSYICVKSRNLSSEVVVLCHISPTLSSLVAGNTLGMVNIHFVLKIYATRQITSPNFTIDKDK